MTRRFVSYALAVVLAACGGSDATTPTQPDAPSTPTPTTVVLSLGSATLDALGATVQITAEVRDQNGAAMSGVTVTWSSSAGSVASVSSAGLVTAVANGTATVTATAGAASSSASITVQQRPTTMTVTPSTLSFRNPGEAVQLAVTATDANGNPVTDPTVTWSTSDAQVVAVTAAGVASAVGDGSASVTATAGSVTASATAEVRIDVSAHAANKVDIPVGGNAWIIDGDGTEVVAADGVAGWARAGSKVRTWFRTTRGGELRVSVTMTDPAQAAEIHLSVGGQMRMLDVSGGHSTEHFVGAFTLASDGYVAVDLEGATRAGDSFGQPVTLHVSGSAVTNDMAFVPNDDGNLFYFGRRGPSVHLQWQQPAHNVQWMYSEITVPEGQDVDGSYYMANGFTNGYFGIQANAPGQRQVIFSIWSPFETDDPSSIPEDKKIQLLRKGETVTVGEFGNEGSGGQSRMPLLWNAGSTYAFLTRFEPNGDGTTDYTAWVRGPDSGWMLMASFRRPDTNSFATGMYSFLENFLPEQGRFSRYAHYERQWVADETGTWTEVVDLTLTTDNTGSLGYRRDYSGGLMSGRPFLKMGGFFDDTGAPGTVYTRPLSSGPPSVDFTSLP